MKLAGESAKQMEEGISLVFSRWRELLDAVDGMWGGPHSRQKADQFVDSVIDFFCLHNGRELPSIGSLEYLLDGGMDSFRVTSDSVTEVADILMNMYEECLENNYQRIQKLRDTARFFDKGTALTPLVRKAASFSDGVAEDNQFQVSSVSLPNKEGASQAMESDENLLPNHEGCSQAMQLDEAPWITVVSKKSNRKGK
ncbi:hypothetical protein RND81_13G100100 [Saponaria officinalis]|uniref:Pre-rRNA-processing protein TSR2 homolog n=1 Tax=Saponaria officinalis TaxID=3572 RepID=A0AAW1H4B2_SAPOF